MIANVSQFLGLIVECGCHVFYFKKMNDTDIVQAGERPVDGGGETVYNWYNNTNYQKRKEDTSKVLVYNSYIYPTLERMRKLRSSISLHYINSITSSSFYDFQTCGVTWSL